MTAAAAAPSPEPVVPAVRLHAVSRHFGGLHAVDGVNLDVPPGQRRLVLGPNGAGKSVLFNLIGGQTPVSSGRIELHGEDITDEAPRRRARRGLARTFQFSSVFPTMTVLENLLIADLAASPRGPSPFRTLPDARRVPDNVTRVCDEWELGAVRDVRVDELSYGRQRELDIVMALMHAPRVLLLDEPAAGLAAAERSAITEMIRSLGRDVTVLLIEHDIEVAFEVADWVTVLHMGAVIAEGEPSAVAQMADVQRAYFGES